MAYNPGNRFINPSELDQMYHQMGLQDQQLAMQQQSSDRNFALQSKAQANQARQMDMQNREREKTMAENVKRLRTLAQGFGMPKGVAETMSSGELEGWTDSVMKQQTQQKGMRDYALRLAEFRRKMALDTQEPEVIDVNADKKPDYYRLGNTILPYKEAVNEEPGATIPVDEANGHMVFTGKGWQYVPEKSATAQERLAGLAAIGMFSGKNSEEYRLALEDYKQWTLEQKQSKPGDAEESPESIPEDLFKSYRADPYYKSLDDDRLRSFINDNRDKIMKSWEKQQGGNPRKPEAKMGDKMEDKREDKMEDKMEDKPQAKRRRYEMPKWMGNSL